jgi:hypothetical protein
MLLVIDALGVVVLPFTAGYFFFNERCFRSSPLPPIPGVFSPVDKIEDKPLRGLEAVRGTGETGGESKCCGLENPPPRVV